MINSFQKCKKQNRDTNHKIITSILYSLPLASRAVWNRTDQNDILVIILYKKYHNIIICHNIIIVLRCQCKKSCKKWHRKSFFILRFNETTFIL